MASGGGGSRSGTRVDTDGRPGHLYTPVMRADLSRKLRSGYEIFTAVKAELKIAPLSFSLFSPLLVLSRGPFLFQFLSAAPELETCST